MDALHGILGSELRSDVLAALFSDDTRTWRLNELSKAAKRPPPNVLRELEWLADVGIVSLRLLDGKRAYDVDLTSPLARQLGQFVRQARGCVPDMRQALQRLSLPVTAWLTRAAPVPSGSAATDAPRSDLIVLSYAPRSLIQLHLANVVGRDIRMFPMSVAEWMARLQKGEVVARRARRARKLWVVGSWEELVRLERHHLESKRTLQAAMTDWREDLSDEWDEDWDPFDVKEGTG